MRALWLVAMMFLSSCANDRSPQAIPATTQADIAAAQSAEPTVERSESSPLPTTPPATLDAESPDKSSPAPVFEFSVAKVIEAAGIDMSSSWREGCPVGLDDLRYLRLSHFSYSGSVETGALIVHADVADETVDIFRRLFDLAFPIARMDLVDTFQADDDRSMRANNTSAFNCRFVAGTERWSEHAFGRAIDVNPLVNPYVKGAAVSPVEGSVYADRGQPVVGGIYNDDEVVRTFEGAGWFWGGYWSSGQDYQHFSRSGR